jgi:opacity protein-like surface antigen
LVAIPAFGEPYVGGGLGVSNTDSHNISGKLLAGFQVIPNFGFEVAYTNLGSYRGESANSLSFALIGTLPLGDTWDIYGKWGTTRNYRSFAGSNSQTDFLTGFGVSYRTSPNIVIRFEYENFGKLTNDNTVGSQSSSLGLNVKYSL